MDDSQLAEVVIEAISSLISIAAVCIAVWTVRETQRPRVASYLEHDRDTATVRLIIKNIGNGVARDVRILSFDFSAVPIDYRETIERSFLSSGIPTLVPGASRDTILFAGVGSLKEHGDFNTTIAISYKEVGFLGREKTVMDSFVLETASFCGSLYLMKNGGR